MTLSIQDLDTIPNLDDHNEMPRPSDYICHRRRFQSQILTRYIVRTPTCSISKIQLPNPK